MPGASDFWETWKQKLSQWRLEKLAAIVLESGGVFNIFLAQTIHLIQPFFPTTRHQELSALADVLEESEVSLAFVDFLTEEIDR